MKLQKRGPVSFAVHRRCIITLDTECHTVGALIASRENVSPRTLVSRVAENFFGTASLDAVAVVEGMSLSGLSQGKSSFSLSSGDSDSNFTGRDP